MDLPFFLRRDPTGAGFAFGMLLTAVFALVPASLPLLVAAGVVTVAARPGAAALNGLGVGLLIGLAAAKGLVETAVAAPLPGFTGAPWAAAVALGVVPLALAARQRSVTGFSS